MLTNLREKMSKRKRVAKCDETLRELYLLAVSPNLSFSEKVDTLLRLGRSALGASWRGTSQEDILRRDVCA